MTKQDENVQECMVIGLAEGNVQDSFENVENNYIVTLNVVD